MAYTKPVPGYLTVSKVLAYVMYAWVMIGIILLGLRIFLLAFSANPDTSFVDFVYRTSADYLQPFRGIFPPKPVSQTGYLDVSALFAIIIYGLIGWGFSALINYIQHKIDVFNRDHRIVTSSTEAPATRTNTRRPTNRS